MRRRPNGEHKYSLRLPGYGYAQAGAYYITFCTEGRRRLFGKVIDSMAQLSSAVRAIKATATRRILASRPEVRSPIWQSLYYDHIIRDAIAEARIRHYIEQNPARWKE